MTSQGRPARTAITVAILAAVAATAIALGIVITSGLGFADAAGQPLDVPAVSITPSAAPSTEPSPEPSPTATPSPSPTPDDDSPEVVTGPPPVTVELDDHGGLRDDGSSDDSSGDSSNSGRGNSND
ncbi:cell division protein FtsN [Salinibacterium sp. CAN_S4]|uniref:hypothetical protein n=1 Tax=Salinibacterium sp. CAN_S4 TaxID=2787727 RepID=UPI0018EFBC4A